MRGTIEFQNVEMRYYPNMAPALSKLNFKIEAGQKVAVVGRTGAGKSSLYQLLLGFRKSNNGIILIDRRSINEYSLENIRSNVNVVLQHPFVVQTDTVRMNLDPLGKLSDNLLVQALKRAALASTEAGNYGLDLNQVCSDLSVGQQQLLTLAFALLHDECHLILLDEPTAQVDTQSQRQVLDSIYTMATDNKITTIMIAHRLETAVTYSDKIMLMDKGSVAEFDTALGLLCYTPDDTTVTKVGLFASMVRTLPSAQQQRIIQIAKEKALKH